MKHVFIINSHTTFLSAMGTIQLLRLPANSILMLYMRNYKNDLIEHNFRVVQVTNLFNSIKDLFKSRIKRKKELQKIDTFIEKEIGEKYKLFCPHLQNGVWQAIYTHPLCMEMSYIQEGGIPYSNAYITHPSLKKRIYLFLVNKVYRHNHRIWRGGWYTAGTMKKQKEIHSFSINNLFFKNLPSTNHIIKWPMVNTGVTIKKGSIIFIFDGFVQNGMIERNLYIESCKKLIKQYASSYNYIKFHPAQTDKDRTEIKEYFSLNGFTFELLSDAIPFEMILSSYTNLKVAGFGSSLLYFALDLGHEVICKDSWLLTSPLFIESRKRNGFMSMEECKQALKNNQ